LKLDEIKGEIKFVHEEYKWIEHHFHKIEFNRKEEKILYSNTRELKRIEIKWTQNNRIYFFGKDFRRMPWKSVAYYRGFSIKCVVSNVTLKEELNCILNCGIITNNWTE